MANMLVASCLAGMAFNATRLGNVHAMSHPVGAFFHVPHGVANAIILPHVMEFNALAVPRKLIEVGQALGEPLAGQGEMAAARRAVSGVQQLEADIGIPSSLSDVGVQREAIAAMAVDAMKSGNIPINPRRTEQSDIEGVVRAGAVAGGGPRLPRPLRLQGRLEWGLTTLTHQRNRFPSGTGGGYARLLTQQPGDGPGELLRTLQVRVEGVG